MTYTSIIYEKKEKTAILRLNRPKVLNAMNRQLWTDFMDALKTAKKDDAVGALIITGEGRAFSTGADLRESKERTIEEYREYLGALQETTRQILRFEKPTIAAINGYALGSGYELALACDIRIAAYEAIIGSPEARVNSSVTGGAFRLIQELVGPGKAKELLFTAENIDGQEACRIGLVNYAVPLEELMEKAMEMAGKITANSPFSIRMIKRGLSLAQAEASMEAIMDYEVEACLACVSTKEREKSLDDFHARKTRKESE